MDDFSFFRISVRTKVGGSFVCPTLVKKVCAVTFFAALPSLKCGALFLMTDGSGGINSKQRSNVLVSALARAESSVGKGESHR